MIALREKCPKYGVFSGPYFSVYGLNAKVYGVNIRIQSQYRKIRTRKNSVFGHFSRSVVSSFGNRKFTFYRTKLDGIDIDVHAGEKSYYAEFVIKLREYMNTSTDKKYLLTASPKCLYPNRILGDAFKKNSDKFDFFVFGY